MSPPPSRIWLRSRDLSEITVVAHLDQTRLKLAPGRHRPVIAMRKNASGAAGRLVEVHQHRLG
jgi:hypothetical protein